MALNQNEVFLNLDWETYSKSTQMGVQSDTILKYMIKDCIDSLLLTPSDGEVSWQSQPSRLGWCSLRQEEYPLIQHPEEGSKEEEMKQDAYGLTNALSVKQSSSIH